MKKDGPEKNKRGRRRRGSWIGRKERRGRALSGSLSLKRIGPISTFFFPTPHQIIFGPQL